MNRPSDHHNHLVQIFSTIDSRSRSQHQHLEEQMMVVQMPTTNAATTALAHEPSVIDYGYEDHKPSPKRHYDSKKIVSSSDLLLASPCLLEVTESTASCGATDDSYSYPELNECDFPPIPADRQALKQRSFCRRGGEGHSSLLRAAVMASMDSQEEQGDSGDDAAATATFPSSPSKRPCRRPPVRESGRVMPILPSVDPSRRLSLNREKTRWKLQKKLREKKMIKMMKKTTYSSSAVMKKATKKKKKKMSKSPKSPTVSIPWS
jgi:hypothetical protein